MHRLYTDPELQSYLDEALPSPTMAAIESMLRSDESLRERLARLVGQREAGVHGVGEIWRAHRLTCPTRSQLGSFLLGVLDEPTRDYVAFHLERIGCRWCQANVDDLRQRDGEQRADVATRRRRYFQTSAGLLRRANATEPDRR